MRIKQFVLDKINNVQSRRQIAEALNVGDQNVYRLISKNATDGHLTKLKVLRIISEEVGLPIDDLVEETVDFAIEATK